MCSIILLAAIPQLADRKLKFSLRFFAARQMYQNIFAQTLPGKGAPSPVSTRPPPRCFSPPCSGAFRLPRLAQGLRPLNRPTAFSEPPISLRLCYVPYVSLHCLLLCTIVCVISFLLHCFISPTWCCQSSLSSSLGLLINPHFYHPSLFHFREFRLTFFHAIFSTRLQISDTRQLPSCIGLSVVFSVSSS